MTVKKLGRPTKYKKAYCQMLIDHMAEGLSYESFSGVINVSPRTIYGWESNKAFMQAKEEAFGKSRLFWEKIGIQQSQTGTGNATSFIFNMKNRFPAEWRDKHEVKVDANITEISMAFGERDDEDEDG